MKFFFIAALFVGLGIWANMKAPKETAAVIHGIGNGIHQLFTKAEQVTR